MNKIADTVSLKRSIGLLKAVIYVVGNIIGSGIYVSPVGVLLYSESVGSALLVWCGSAIISVLGALCYAELGATFTQSGSNFTYIRCIFGEFSAFLYLWVYILLVIPAFNAITALVFANYVLAPFFSCSSVPPHAVRIVAALALCFLTFINSRSVNAATEVQGIFTFAKIFALVVIIIAGVYHMCNGYIENFYHPFEGTTNDPGNVVFAFYSGIHAYSGWSFLNQVMEEVQDPHRTLLWAIYISLPLVTIIYLLVNVAYFAVLTPIEMLSTDAVAVAFGDRMLGVMSWIIPISVASSTFGSLNGALFAKSRLYHTASREGFLPGFISMIHCKNCTPVISLLVQCLFSIALLTTTKVFVLINYNYFTITVFETLVLGGMVWLRLKKPHLKRPIKIPLLVPIIFLTVSFLLAITTCYKSPWTAAIGVAITLAGIPAYFVTMHWKDKPPFYRKTTGKITIFLQKLLLCVPAEKKEYELIHSHCDAAL